ncbi:replication-relaxation family protein [Streptomyces sp. NPDC046984]|uniref:replication-relaxation family protein n=1 Tax=Streptomyces sp. NPDC046984 TaxID=3155138 RepID=UPI0033CF2D74
MVNGDAGGGDRLALAVLAQHRMATTQQVHLMISPAVRIEQTRRRLVKLRGEGLIDRVTLPQAGRTRVWFVTQYGAEVASEWPELREWRPPRLGADRTAARLRAGHTLVVTETARAFVQDARRRGDVCQPLDWIPEVYHSLGGGEALIPDALLYYRRQANDRDRWSMLRAFVEVDRATMGPERLAAKISAYERLYRHVPVTVGRPRPGSEIPVEEWRRRYPVFPRVLFVLAGTGPTGIDNRISALHAGAKLTQADFLRDVPMLATSLTDVLRDGPSAPVWRPLTDPGKQVSWTDSLRG